MFQQAVTRFMNSYCSDLKLRSTAERSATGNYREDGEEVHLVVGVFNNDIIYVGKGAGFVNAPANTDWLTRVINIVERNHM